MQKLIMPKKIRFLLKIYTDIDVLHYPDPVSFQGAVDVGGPSVPSFLPPSQIQNLTEFMAPDISLPRISSPVKLNQTVLYVNISIQKLLVIGKRPPGPSPMSCKLMLLNKKNCYLLQLTSLSSIL